MTEDRLEAFGIHKMAQLAFDDFWEDSEIVGKDYRGRELVKQQVRSMDSVCANVEEGYGRGSNKEMPQHLKIARGEARESKGSDHTSPATRHSKLVTHTIRSSNVI